MIIMAICFFVAIILLWTKRTAAAALLILPFTVNIVAFHLVLDGGLFNAGAIMGNVLLLLNVYFLWQYRTTYKQLLEQAEREAKKLGAHKIWLETGAEWSARKLYDSLGYVERGILKNFYGHKDFIIFDKDL